jgi:energy-coupling factor transport system permease protein
VLAAPLRKLRLPVDEWATAIALCLRSLPLLIEEMRVLRAARRLRPRNLAAYRDRREHPLVDVITATMSVSLRRAAELGEAITARGGTGQLAAYPARPGRADVIALTVIGLVVALGAILGVLTL